MRTIALLVIVVMLAATLGAQGALRHTPPVELTTGTQLVLEYDGDLNAVNIVNIYYRTTGDPAYTEAEMTRSEGVRPSYTFRLPTSMQSSLGVEYYFGLTLNDGSSLTLPAVQPDANPYRVLGGPSSQGNSGFVLLSPELGSVPGDEPLMIAISTFALQDDLDPQSVKIVVNGEDMTDRAEVGAYLIALTIDRPQPGALSFQVTARTKNGGKISSPSWNSKVGNPLELNLPMNLSGDIIGNCGIMNLSADDSSLMADDDENRADLDVNLRGGGKRYNFDTRVYISSREKKYRQPVDRFRIGLNAPHTRLALGDDSPDYSTLTLNNKNLRGAHFEFNNQDFDMKFDYGQSRRAIDGTLASDGALQTAGTFKRNTMGLRFELGNMRRMKLGLSIVKSKDDKGSLDEKYWVTTDENGQEKRVTTPEDNFVTGFDFSLFMLNQRLIVGMENALSLYNRDITDGAISKADLDTLGMGSFPFDPESLESIIVINTGMEPIKPGADCMAHRVFATANFGGNYLNASYAIVGSAFNSLAANYLQKDTKTLSLTDNLSLLRQQLLLTVGYNGTQDNLADQKETTNKSNLIFAQMLIRPTGYPMLRLGYQNSGVKDTGETKYVDQKSSQMSVGVIHDVDAIETAPTRVGVSFDQTQSKDNLNHLLETQMNTISLNAQTDFANLPLSTRIGYSMNLNDNKTRAAVDATQSDVKDTYHSVNVRGDLNFLKKRLTPFLEWQLTAMTGDSKSQNRNLVEIGTGYRATENLFLTTQAGLLKYANDEANDVDYSKFDWRARATYRF
jgi:hypothetical protein